MPIISLAVFWGPIVLLILKNFEKFCAQARSLGPGVVFIIVISLILGICNEPRFITLGWPFIVLSMVLSIERTTISRHFKYILILLTILFAQFFLKINYSPWLGGDYAGLLEFPKQLYFMHIGAWMSWISFLLQFIALTLAFLMLNYIKKS